MALFAWYIILCKQRVPSNLLTELKIAFTMPRPTELDHVAHLRDERDLEQNPFPFLALPPEIRQAVYDCCLIDNSDDDPQQIPAFHKRVQSLKPLLLTCQKINKELTPLFFRTATFKVDSKRDAKNVAGANRNHSVYFEYLFMNTLPGYKMRNIRKLTYNATVETLVDARTPLSSGVDFDGLQYFSGVLSRYGDALECLQEVQLYADLRKVYRLRPGWHTVMDALTADSTHALWSKNATLYAPEVMDRSKNWESIENKLCGGALKGWNVSRMVYRITGKEPPPATFITAIVVTFYKPSDRVTTTTTKAATDCFTVVRERAGGDARRRRRRRRSNAVVTWVTKRFRPIDGV